MGAEVGSQANLRTENDLYELAKSQHYNRTGDGGKDYYNDWSYE